MADFCAQCAKEYFGEEACSDFINTTEPPLEPGYGWVHLCEGCGYILTDDPGNCIYDCDKHHKVLTTN